MRGFKSIKTRVVWQVTTLIALAMLLVMTMVSLIAYGQMHEQMLRLLQTKTSALQMRMEQRLDYLWESSLLLAKNEFVVNAFIDGHIDMLPSIVRNYVEGKDVLTLSIVDFDGKPLYQMSQILPSFHTSSQLRAALAMGKVATSINESNQVLLVAPISYYNTVQGAIIVTFDLEEIAHNAMMHDDNLRVKLYSESKEVYDHNTIGEAKTAYFEVYPDATTPHLQHLKLTVVAGVLEDEFMDPVYDIILRLAGVGVLFILAGVGVSVLLSRSITQPILTLYDRVKRWDMSQNIICSPIGTEDELEKLAVAFDEQSMALTYQAEHDALTGLPNRFLFDVFMEHAIVYATEHSASFALLFIDLDNFKEINDSFGHLTGDALLKTVASKLSMALDKTDKIARMGGDEFAIIMHGNLSQEALITRIDRIMQHFRHIQIVESYKFFISCSIGVVLYPQNGHDAQTLLKNADAAMYKSKEEGKNGYYFYTKDMTEKAYERVVLEAKLHDAIKNNEFVVYYQPQMDMRTQTIQGLEALVRWKLPNATMIAPNEFIPLAEKTGMIIAIDDFVMQRAMQEYMMLHAQGFRGTLSLNLSMLQLNQRDFVEKLRTFIAVSGMPKLKLKLEVTETQVMKNPDIAIMMLEKIRNMGIGLAVDDFGTGHSSLSYLKQLPIEKIKIDQSFIRDLPQDADDAQLTRTIISLAHNLRLSVIAEGVETQEQVAFLMQHECFEAQGYFYHKPLPFEEIRKLIV